MNEYIEVGHMTPITLGDNSPIYYYMPHQGVFNENNKTTRLRVVFDASSQSDSGFSLNHLQYTGPTIQDDVISILMRFRQHPIVLCADIVKMFRQIRVDPAQR